MTSRLSRGSPDYIERFEDARHIAKLLSSPIYAQTVNVVAGKIVRGRIPPTSVAPVTQTLKELTRSPANQLLDTAVLNVPLIGFSVMELWRIFAPKKEENLSRLTAAVNRAEPVIQQHKQLAKALDTPVAGFLDIVQRRHGTAHATLQSLVANMQVTRSLMDSVESLNVRNVEAGLDVMRRELEEVLQQHGRNLVMFPVVLDALERSAEEQKQAQRDLQDAQDALEDVAFEIEALKVMIAAEALEAGQSIDAIVGELSDN
jgi:nucleotide-binding universal stress UspA family protein